MRISKSIICCVVMLWFAGSAFATDFQAKVIHIADGDTITVLNDINEQIKIRLNGIDCPEKAQAYGNKAKQFTKDLVQGQMVTIQAYDTDRYGRTIGDVILEDGRNVNQELVKAGLAWWYRKYAPGNTVLEKLETEAREAKEGLWNDPHPIPPWDFRHGGKRTLIKPKPSPSPSSTINPPSEFFDSLPVRGNQRSHKYHRPDCPSYDLISPKNRIPFESAQKARDAGYAIAGNCSSRSSQSLLPQSNQTSSIRGNKRSKKYHRPDCPSYNRIAKKNRVPFGSLQEARDAGYVLAGNCP